MANQQNNDEQTQLTAMMKATAAIEAVHGRQLTPDEAALVWLAYSIARVDAVREAQEYGREDQREDQPEHRAEG